MQQEEQLSLDQLEKEILQELNSPEAVGITDPSAATRKSYHISDFDNPRDKEMAVFTHAKKLSEYIFVITEKSPKKYRWSIISRLQNASVELVENLYRANFERDEALRITFQKCAAVCIKLIDFYAETARKKQAITIRQTAVLAKHIAETEKLLNGWVRSTKRKM
ncbi:MAG: four helix bundle protein [Clostridia bacterium]|jgi:hypothetical protein|nr:four helix bundle protein [Clostridia bacterium]